MSSLQLVISGLPPVRSPGSFSNLEGLGQCSIAGGLLCRWSEDPDLVPLQLLWLQMVSALSSLFLMGFKLCSIFSISISHTSGQALCGFLGSVLRRIGSQYSEQCSSGRWFWLWLKDNFEIYLRKIPWWTVCQLTYSPGCQRHPEWKVRALSLPSSLGLGRSSFSPAPRDCTCTLCSLQTQTAQSHFAVTLPVGRSVFKRLIVSSRKKLKNTLLDIGVLLALENQPTFFFHFGQRNSIFNERLWEVWEMALCCCCSQCAAGRSKWRASHPELW